MSFRPNSLNPSLLRTFDIRRVLEDHRRKIQALDYSHDGILLASTARCDKLCVRNIHSGVDADRILMDCDKVQFLDVMCGCTVAVSTGKTIGVFDMGRSRQAISYQRNTAKICSLAIRPKSSHFISCAKDGKIMLWDVRVHDPMARVDFGLKARSPLASFEGNGDIFGVCTADHSSRSLVRLYDVRNIDAGPYDSHNVLNPRSGVPTCFRIEPNGQFYIVSFSDPEAPTVQVYYVATGKLQTVLTGHSNQLNMPQDAVFSRDVRFVASPSSDNSVCIWELNGRTGNLVHCTKQLHSKPIHALAFNPVVPQLATAAKEIILWGPSTFRRQTLNDDENNLYDRMVE